MTTQDIISLIASSADQIRAEGVTALYLYGSRVRGDARSDSDLDVFVEFDQSRPFSLVELAGVKLTLEDALHLDVHITTRHSLHPLLRADIERAAVQAF